MSVWMDNIGSATFRRARTVAVNQSPFNGTTYRSGMQDDRWQFQFDYDLLTREQAAPLLGAIAGQRNGTGAMEVYDPDFKRPGAVFSRTNNAIVNGSGQTGVSLLTAWSVGLVQVARAGDKLWIGDTIIGPRMYEVVADAYSISGGAATILLDIPMRASSAGGTVVGLTWGDNGIYMNARMTGFEKTSRSGGLFQISVTGEEIVP